LTALAVLNFVWGGLVFIGALIVFGTAGKVSQMLGVPANSLYLAGLLSLLTSTLLIVSGVGYLGQKKVLGRILGNAYGAFSIISTVVNLVTVPNGFGVGTVIGLIYPVLTLILLNTTFKDNLVN
jgi:hypothetical protein